jgi:hypothetical protein
MSTLDDWTAAVAEALDVRTLPDVPAVLELARDVAHGVERPAAPVTAWLAGFAAASGLDPAEAAARIRALLPP